MKLSERIIRVALFALILLSLVLTYAIWLSPTSKTADINTSKQTVKNDQNYAKATDAFYLYEVFGTCPTGNFKRAARTY